MSFLTALALFGSLLVALPFLAHRLRRRSAEEHVFGPVHLLPASQPEARKRARLEDRGVFAVRALSVLLLALLGASPFVRCSRLSLSRGGASVALVLVVDDSMSMRATDVKPSRFAKAKAGALQLLSSLREGDEVSVVLAGTPPRVVLASTSDLEAVRGALRTLSPQDRATDLEGALALGRGLLASRPHVDKRLVLLSDLSDGRSDAAPLRAEGDVTLWNALPELGKVAQDCAVLSADRAGRKVQVQLACSDGASLKGRKLELLRGPKSVVATDLDGTQLAVSLGLPDDDEGDLDARLSPGDAIAEDDVAPVMQQVRSAALAVIAEATREGSGAAGSPLVEQALRALPLNLPVRSLPVLPDQAVDLRSFAGVVLDDPPGLTPEQRRALLDYMNEGGTLLVSLGRRAEAAPLGASFDPILSSHVTFAPLTAGNEAEAKVSPAKSPRFTEASLQLLSLAPKARARLAPADVSTLNVDIAFADGAPLLAHKSVGKGLAYVVTLPFRAAESELPLRPGFLMILDRFAEDSQGHLVPERIPVGAAWVFPRGETVSVVGPEGVVAPLQGDLGQRRVVPAVAGRYRVSVGSTTEPRAAQVHPGELDFRPRAVVSADGKETSNGAAGKLDVSWIIALALLALMAIELCLRAWSGAHRERAAGTP